MIFAVRGLGKYLKHALAKQAGGEVERAMADCSFTRGRKVRCANGTRTADFYAGLSAGGRFALGRHSIFIGANAPGVVNALWCLNSDERADRTM